MATVGAVFRQRYRVVSLLHRGGMGDVYQAWDLQTDAPVALKEMGPQPELAPYSLDQLRQQFEQEAIVLSRMEHLYLVHVIDFFEQDGHAYLVMDFIDGTSLAERLQEGQALPEAQVLAWAHQLLDALEYCHNQGVIHRDVTPQNVIIRPDGSAVLVDFGLVKLWPPPRTQMPLQAIGTPEYAPPEQCQSGSDHTDPRSDIYSLGATLYHALTGYAPVTSMKRVLDLDTLPSLQALNPKISARTAKAIMCALELQPVARFASARKMAVALLGVETRDSVSAQDESQARACSRPLLHGALVRRAANGLVIAHESNLAWLLALPKPPQRVWWEKAQMELCLVPAGEFPIGITEREMQCWLDEADEELRRYIPDSLPRHTVYLDAFYVGRTPVTQAQYARFVRHTGYRVPYDEWNKTYSWDRRRKAPPPGKEQHPVVLVSWHDAVAYGEWAGLRLPTEAEWEKAASWDAPLAHKCVYPWGDVWMEGCCNSREAGLRGTCEVSSYHPQGDSAYGCTDMAGNVREWTSSLYRDDPVNGLERINEVDARVLRGGAFVHSRGHMRCALRSRDFAIVWGRDIGFRLVATPGFPPAPELR
jgi:formylglycine-generating enzyme required for sulfatase activity